MDRFTHNGYAMVKNDDGRYVLHSDHAAELAEWKQRAERAEAYVAGQDVRSDFRNAGEMRAALDSTISSIVAACKGSGCLNAHELRAAMDRTHKRATNAEKENTLLRAECEAWRAFRKAQTDGLCSDVGDAIVATFRYAELLDAVDAARAATDAAGILRKLPQASDFSGTGRVDITGGVDSADYVRDMRDGAKGAE